MGKVKECVFDLQCLLKWGSARSSNPFGILLPLMACWPTHAIIWDILMNEPVEKRETFTSTSNHCITQTANFCCVHFALQIYFSEYFNTVATSKLGHR